ncbi:MAG: phage major capsid protein [Proteobacteria bacterium]|nr:phage major capsid protein [Pseudomonadota bacterium]MCL2306771.1 phage major capsid protein [Pseudomonadota bacterium]
MTQKIKPGSRAFRHVTITRSMVNEDDRSVEISFSSEEPVEQWWGIEILDHSKGAMRVDRLKSGAAPLLVNHDWGDQVGVIDALLESEGKGRAKVRFSKSARGAEIMQDVNDGIRTCISVGYIIHDSILEREKDGVGTYRITDWEPFEVSIVSVPADTTVGVGRGLDRRSQIEFLPNEENIMDGDKVVSGGDNRTAEKINTQEIEQRARENERAVERQRVADITAAGRAFKDFGGAELAAEYVANGKSLGEFQRAMQERVAEKSNKPTKTADIGMTGNEVRQFSFLRALNALANPTDRKAYEAAAFERECSEAAAKVAGKASRGFMVPNDVLRRELSVANAASAGSLVDDKFLVSDFITMLRNAMVISNLGVRTMTGLVGDITIPRQIGGNAAYWVGEGEDVDASEPAFDQIKLSPRTVGSFTEVTRKLLIQSSIDIEAFVRQEIATTIGLEIERVALFGDGSGESPLGIANMTGIGSVAIGANGGAPTWKHMVDMETQIAVSNALAGNMAYVTNAKVRGKLKTTIKEASVPGYVWADGGNPINGYRAEVTNAVPSNLSKGTGTNLSAMIFGNWADLILAFWSGLDLTVDPYTKATSGGVRIVGLMDVDVSIRRAESFSRMMDIATA